MQAVTCITPAPSVSVMSVTTTDPGTKGVSADSTADVVISASYHHRWETTPPALPTPVVESAAQSSDRLPFTQSFKEALNLRKSSYRRSPTNPSFKSASAESKRPIRNSFAAD